MICFDTAPVIWGVQGVARPEQTEMVARTKKYIAYLDSTGNRVMIPAPVVAEYLTGFATDQQNRECAILERQFIIPALDLPAARLAAYLQSNTGLLKEIRKAHGVDRQSLRTDAFIIAIAILNMAEKIVTHDQEHMRKLAQDRIEVIEVPDITVQPGLFPPQP